MQQQATEHHAALDRMDALHKSSLDKIAYEHQTRFSKLHEKRAEAVAELYYLVATLKHLLDSVHGGTEYGCDYKENVEVIRRIGDKLETALMHNAIYLPKSICKSLETFHQSVMLGQIYADTDLPKDELLELVAEYNGQAELVKELLEAEFRAILDGSNEANS